MDIAILYEDEHLLAINKPAGLGVHKDGVSSGEWTVADWVAEIYPALKEVGEPFTAANGMPIEKPGIVHRLDKDTSGVLLIAKDQPTYLFLKRQFSKHTIVKTYLALVYGNFSADKQQGTISLPIGRSRKDPRKRLAMRAAGGVVREALTHYQVLGSFPGFSYIEAHPKTGRTHQIRVHFKAINHPIVCDPLYAEGQPCLPGLSRQALHAFAIEFTLSGRSLRIEAPVPADFQGALATLETM
jgi:23S rRNA pseudouridine1911/1915/1917 synthase